ncbi:RagB/SusD family nutrient uptake outer membrane protein [Pedobacter gandavensis]|uniref:RagB/SusD family nutrient uptake outer membrane protein n=1 Tax=Pedobacter gandavensis TaxID=2679963 RepID=UPI0024799E8E|nr:RagB/SusD family nutrient uptake outer membrane protein [Pedobacter gandavensis]WGQ10749.1 RagB/SusD family nutrient uptake outer membrane protein [Pedobacter gandavensis]
MKYIYVILSCILFSACKKNWLDAKPTSSLIIPTKVEDFQALLDNPNVMNLNQCGGAGELSAGDFQTTYEAYLSSPIQDRNAYTWAVKDDYYEGSDADWRNAYQRVLFANLALEGLMKIPEIPINQQNWNIVKGSALFYRAYQFFDLAQAYCKPYSENAALDLGLPLRLASDINQKVKRSNLKQTYEKIIADLNEALSLLPLKPLYKTRPSQPAVYALLARIYLSMSEYPNALLNANSCLKLSNRLMDYSTLEATDWPFPQFNDEVIYHCVLGGTNASGIRNMDVVPELLNLYESNDLRFRLYFRKIFSNIYFKGSYDRSNMFFSGLAVDEILLIRAECNARSGNLTEALFDLNNLLKNRWVKTPAYIDFTSVEKEVVLSKILLERRKQLCFRGIRWQDLRRLNQDSNHKTTLSRTLNGETYMLPPNDPRYIFPIDLQEIKLNGIEQNSRK